MTDIRRLKKALLGGSPVMLRGQLEWVKGKQGPRENKRCSKDGLEISVIPISTESNSSAKWIDKAKFAYISRNGSNRPVYATVSEYQVLGPSSEIPMVPKLEISQDSIDKVKSKTHTAMVWVC